MHEASWNSGGVPHAINAVRLCSTDRVKQGIPLDVQRTAKERTALDEDAQSMLYTSSGINDDLVHAHHRACDLDGP